MAMEGMDTVVLDMGGDISEGGDLGELGVWKSTGDIRAGVVMADTYLCEHRIPHISVVEEEAESRKGKGDRVHDITSSENRELLFIVYLSVLTLEHSAPLESNIM